MIFFVSLFCPLLGFFIFQSINTQSRDFTEVEFPSPTGVLYISINKITIKNGNCQLFPSPIGVLYISIADYKSWGVKFGFPSPIGVLYISIITTRADSKIELTFPSPTGVLYISIDKQWMYKIEKFNMFPSPTGVLYISNVTRTISTLNITVFPSPIGVLYISIITKDKQKLYEKSFRPLLGFFIFQLTIVQNF